MKIAQIHAREIYNSRGLPSIECNLILQDGSWVQASVPAGLSVGAYEAIQLRDNEQRLMGMGVHKAIETIENVIAPVLIGKEPHVVDMDLELINLDGTPNKSRLGANAMLAISMALIRAQALVSGVELYELIAHLLNFEVVTIPFPLFNIINGGAHADNNLMIQEIMVLPVGYESFCQAMQAGVELSYALKELLKEKGKSICLGDEGGFAPQFTNQTEAFDYILQAMDRIGCKDMFRIAIDVAASQFFNVENHTYTWNNTSRTTQEMIQFYADLVKQYPIFSIEDGLSEYDIDGWQALTHMMGDTIQLVGDDLFATNPHRIVQGIEQQLANAAIIKPNQVGTVTETLQAIKLCQEYGMNPIISHRSGETEDTFIADLAVGSNAGLFKGGGCFSGQSIAKYNQLLRIEEELVLMQQ